MAFNPFEHWDELVFSNVYGGPAFGLPHKETIALPGGQIVDTATPGHPETITFWMRSDSGLFHQVSEDQAFAQSLWLNFAYGASTYLGYNRAAADLLGLYHEYHVTPAALLAAIDQTPILSAALEARGYSDADVLAYVADVAPGVLIVGQTAYSDSIAL
jgi:hypothetical protein